MQGDSYQTDGQHPEIDMPEATVKLMLATRRRCTCHVQGAACGWKQGQVNELGMAMMQKARELRNGRAVCERGGLTGSRHRSTCRWPR